MGRSRLKNKSKHFKKRIGGRHQAEGDQFTLFIVQQVGEQPGEQAGEGQLGVQEGGVPRAGEDRQSHGGQCEVSEDTQVLREGLRLGGGLPEVHGGGQRN